MTNSPLNHLFGNSLLVKLFLIAFLLGQADCLQAAIDSSIKDSTVLQMMAKLENAQEDTAKVSLLNDIGLAILPSDPVASQQKAQEALTLSKALNYPRGVVASYNLLALYEEHTGHYLKAIEYYLDALEVFKEEGQRKDLPPILHNIGTAYHHQADFEKSLEYLFRCLEIYRELEDHPGTANCLNTIGNVFRDKPDGDKAQEYHKQALAEAKIAGNDRFIAMASLNLAGDLDYIENFELVRKSFHEALEAFDKVDDKKGEAIVYNNLGALHLENGMFVKAVGFFDTSIEKAKVIDFKPLLAHNYNLINHACAGAGDYKRAHEFALLLNELNQELVNESKVQAIAELETKYQVERKEHALLDQQHQIEKLEHDKLVRNYMLFGGATLVILLGLLIWGWFRSYKQTKAAEDTAIRHQLDLYVKEVELLKNQPKDLPQPEEKQIFPATLSNLLSERELEVFNELANGKTNKDMAETLFVSVNTIKSHLKNIYEKLDVKNRTQAVKKVLEAETNPI